MDHSVSLTDNNPFRKLQRPDGTASARAMLKTGKFHTRWANLNAAVVRARDEYAGHFGETAAQSCFHSTMQTVRAGALEREVPDWDLTPVAQLYTCLKSDLPDTNLWFVATGLEALGFAGKKPAEPAASATPVKRALLTPFEVASYAAVGVGYLVGPDGTEYRNLKAEEARRGIEWMEGRQLAAEAVKADMAQMAALPASVIPLPGRWFTEARKVHFDSRHGTWEQGEEAVKNMLWSNDPPAGLDFHRLFTDARRTLETVSGAATCPTWKQLVLLADNLRARIGDAAGGWQPPALA